MPYIKQTQRYIISSYTGYTPNDCGELNYMITMLCKNYMLKKGEKYQHYNDCIGALESAKLELYRRHIVPYEDLKIQENGDV